MKARKILVSLAALALVAAISIGGTLAYLTSQKTVTNTFTVGNVQINLDEAAVNPDGTQKYKDEEKTVKADRVNNNSYHLLPGHEYIKDPTVTVLKDSEACYVRALVTVNFSKELDEIFAPNGANLTDIFGTLGTGWSYYDDTEDEAANTRTYEFRYKQDGSDIVAAVTEDTKLPALFEKVTVPDGITGEQLATLTKTEGGVTTNFQITVVAEAIQADGLTAEEAWNQLDTTYHT